MSLALAEHNDVAMFLRYANTIKCGVFNKDMGFKTSLKALGQIRTILNNEFANVDFQEIVVVLRAKSTALSDEQNMAYAKKLELVFEVVAPVMVQYARLHEASRDYVSTQILRDKKMTSVIKLIMVMLIFLAMWMAFAYLYTSSSQMEWSSKMVYVSGVMIAIMITCMFMAVILASIKYRTLQSQDTLASVPELDRYRQRINDNALIKYAAAISSGKTAEYAQSIVAKLGEETDDVSSFCKRDPRKLDGGKCELESPCKVSEAVPLRQVLFDTLKRTKGEPCSNHLLSSLETMMEISDGRRANVLNQRAMWYSIYLRMEEIKRLVLVQYRVDVKSKKLADDEKLAIIDSVVIAGLQVPYVEALDLKPSGLDSTQYFTAPSKTACYQTCIDDTDCKMCHYDGSHCYLHRQAGLQGGYAVDPTTLGKVVRLENAPASAGNFMLIKDTQLNPAGMYVCNRQGLAHAYGVFLVTHNMKAPQELPCLSDDACVAYSLPGQVETFAESNTIAPLSYTADAPSSGLTYKQLFRNADLETSSKFCVKSTLPKLFEANSTEGGLLGALREMAPTLTAALINKLMPYGQQIDVVAYADYVHRGLLRYYGEAWYGQTRPIIDKVLRDVRTAVFGGKASYEYQFVSLDEFQQTLDSWNDETYEGFRQDVQEVNEMIVQYVTRYTPRLKTVTTVISKPIMAFSMMTLMILLFNYVVFTINCYVKQSCTMSEVVRKCVMAICFFGFMYAVAISMYRRFLARVNFNFDMTVDNGAKLSSAMRMLVKDVDAGSDVDKTMAMYFVSSEAAPEAITLKESAQNVQSVTGAADTMYFPIVIRSGSNEIEFDAVAFPKLTRIELSLKTPPANALTVTALFLTNETLNRTYIFRNNTNNKVVLRSGQVSQFALASTSVPWDSSSALGLKHSWTLKVITVPTSATYHAMFLHIKQIIRRYDACNTVNNGIRQLPFPSTEITVYLLAILFTICVVAYIIYKMQPMQKVANVRTLNSYKNKLKYGEAVDGLQYVINCCKTPDSVWNIVLNYAVVILVLLALIIISTIMNAGVAYKQGLYSTGAYVASRCV